MEQLLKEHDRLESKANLSKAIEDVQIIIDQLRRTKEGTAKRPGEAQELLDAQYKMASAQFDRVNNDLKDIYSGLGKYGRALDKKFKERPLPFTEQDTLASNSELINRAIAMHLLREGHFDVAAIFMAESNANTSPISDAMDVDSSPLEPAGLLQKPASQSHRPSSMPASFSPAMYKQPDSLHQQFQEMYSILNSLRQNQDLGPAIDWARKQSALLEARGSNLEYDLCQLQYIILFKSGPSGPTTALKYARETFPVYPTRYRPNTQRLVGALAFTENLLGSPYADLFASTHYDTTSIAAAAFTSEFCSLLSLSSASPLLTAVTAGCIALPTLLKLSQIQQMHRTSWTTASELPVEVPLPPAYKFHSIFVCPVSKEQSTDANPPMMMPCFHVICKESLDRVSRGGRFKCPYCPAESHKSEAKRVFV